MACRHQQSFSAERQALFRHAAHAEVLRSSQHNRAHHELAGKHTILTLRLFPSRYFSTMCSVYLHVTLCMTPQLVLYLRRVQLAKNATQLFPFMPVLCWPPSATAPARTRHQWPKVNSAAGVGSCQKLSSWQHSGETILYRKGLVEM